MKNCIACTQSGIKRAANQTDFFYGKNNGSTSIKLCYSHSVELFKTGQTNFATKYHAEALTDSLNKKEMRSSMSGYFSFSSFK